MPRIELNERDAQQNLHLESGATPAPATSVSVNGSSAQTYGDFTFARPPISSLVEWEQHVSRILRRTYLPGLIV